MANRDVKVGDMVIQNGDILSHPEEIQYYGIVYKIMHDTYHQPTNVFLKWTPNFPPEYDETSGYSYTNIHNQYSKFDILKGQI